MFLNGNLNFEKNGVDITLPLHESFNFHDVVADLAWVVSQQCEGFALHLSFEWQLRHNFVSCLAVLLDANFAQYFRLSK
jgi:hypothetical protein